jgi:hypothetical protein
MGYRSVTDIIERGWTSEPFGLSEGEMAEYARSARGVIELALEDDGIRDIISEPNGTIMTGLIEKHRTKDGHDSGKETLQMGLSSQAYADSRIAERYQPFELLNFWDNHAAVLDAGLRCARNALDHMGATEVADALLDDKLDDRIALVRTNWFRDAVGVPEEPGSEEILSGHSDRSIVTLHLYETHGGYLQGIPYKREDAFSPEDEKRRRVAASLANLRPVEPQDGEAVVFLGAGWWTLWSDLVPPDLENLPVLYHVATKPAPENLVTTRYANLVTGGRPDRFSVVTFFDPPQHFEPRGLYTVPSPDLARPLRRQS